MSVAEMLRQSLMPRVLLGCNADVELAYEWLVFSRPVRQREKRLRREVIRHDALILDDEGVVTRFRHQISHTQFINKAEEV